MYIEHRGYSGGPWQYYLDIQDSPVAQLMHASLFVLTFLGDLIVVSLVIARDRIKPAQRPVMFAVMALLGSMDGIQHTHGRTCHNYTSTGLDGLLWSVFRVLSSHVQL